MYHHSSRKMGSILASPSITFAFTAVLNKIRSPTFVLLTPLLFVPLLCLNTPPINTKPRVMWLNLNQHRSVIPRCRRCVGHHQFFCISHISCHRQDSPNVSVKTSATVSPSNLLYSTDDSNRFPSSPHISVSLERRHEAPSPPTESPVSVCSNQT